MNLLGRMNLLVTAPIVSLGGHLPVGSEAAVYAPNGTFSRRVPLDAETGDLTEPLTLAPGEALWVAAARPDGSLTRLDHPQLVARRQAEGEQVG